MILNCIGVVVDDKYEEFETPRKAIFPNSSVLMYLEHDKGTQIFNIQDYDTFIVSETIEEIEGV